MSEINLEQHYTVQQVAKKWAMSPDKIRAIFRCEPDVMRIGTPETRFKRAYINLRIPESAVKRMEQRFRKI